MAEIFGGENVGIYERHTRTVDDDAASSRNNRRVFPAPPIYPPQFL